MIADKHDWRLRRSKSQLALADDLGKRLRTNLGDAESRFFLITLSPHRSEFAHLSDRDRQYASAKCGPVHNSLMGRTIRLYRQWNCLFFKQPSARIGNHFPALICIDDPVVMSGGVTHDESNGPHVHMVIGIQAKHLDRFNRMQTAGYLRADAERVFPRGKLHLIEIPASDVARTASYSLKYDFQTVGDEPLWKFFFDPHLS